MKLIVIGAGYVGMALLSHLKHRQHEIFITTTSQERAKELLTYGKGVFVFQSGNDKGFQDLIDSCDGMVVLVAPKNSKNYEETYLKTAQSISHALKGRQRPLYILYTSSTSVYEGNENEWVNEDRFLQPKSENGMILAETERVYLNSGANTCILRLGGIYGPKRELTDRARRLSGKEMPGTGDEPTNNIHLEDIVAAIAFCIDHSLTGIYNLVNDDHPSRKELYSDLCKSLMIPLPLWNSDSSALEKGGYIVSNEKIKKAGFTFKAGK